MHIRTLATTLTVAVILVANGSARAQTTTPSKATGKKATAPKATAGAGGQKATGAAAKPAYRDKAFLAREYTVYMVGGSTVEKRRLDKTVLLVTSQYFMPIDDIQSQRAFLLRDLDKNALITDAEVIQYRNQTAKTHANYFVLVADFDMTGRYQVVLRYSDVGAWTGKADEEPRNIPDAIVVSEVLARGRDIDNNHVEVDADASKGYSGVEAKTGLAGLFERGRLTLTPEVGDDSSGLGLKYAYALNIGNKHYTGDVPRNLSFNIDVDGRYREKGANGGLSGYANGDINLKYLFLLESDGRYYPAGIRAGLGYEAKEDLADARVKGSAQAVVTLPVLDRVLLGWHELIGINRPFAPPFVSAGYVYSDDSDTTNMRLSRTELEFGWHLPVAEKWDLRVRWQRFDFRAAGMKDEELWEAQFIYYPSESQNHGVTMGFEEGFRPVLGDIGKTVMLGYMIRGF